MTKSNIATALAKAQASMGKAIKQANNPHFRTKYADLGNVMEACLPALNEHGIALVQPTGEEDGQRFVETILIHGESGEHLSCRVPLIVAKNDMQGYGSAVTYARRYGLMAMAGIAPEDDDGNAASKSPPPKQEPESQEPSDISVFSAIDCLKAAKDQDELKTVWLSLSRSVKKLPEVVKAKDDRKDALENQAPETPPQPADDLNGDEIPYYKE